MVSPISMPLANALYFLGRFSMTAVSSLAAMS